MAKVLNYESQIQQGELVQSWHVSQSVDAFTGVQDYAISISGSVNLTSSLSIKPINLLTTGQNYVLTYNNTTGQVFKALSSSITEPISASIYRTGSSNSNIIPALFGSNVASGTNSAIASGCNNLVVTLNSFIGGGKQNTASADVSGLFIGAGECNIVGNLSDGTSSPNASIVGGFKNRIYSSSRGEGSFIGGGYCNLVDANYSSILGGFRNTSSGGGFQVIAGGCDNDIGSQESFIGGGCSNNIDGESPASVVGGGYNNKIISSSKGAIFSGNANCVCEMCGFIGGGSSNLISVSANNLGFNVIGGGQSNEASCGGSAVLGGAQNDAKGCLSFIGGGFFNKNDMCYGTIVGGCDNKLASTGCRSSIVGGDSNTISSSFSFIGGGEANTSSGGDYNVIVGGFDNVSFAACSFIGAGSGSFISGSNDHASFIGAGKGNKIHGHKNLGSSYSAIVAGDRNLITGATSSFDGSNFIGAGQENKIEQFSHNSNIAGGFCNLICNTSNSGKGSDNVIGGGSCNCIIGHTPGFNQNTISGGERNLIEVNSGSISGSSNGSNFIAGGVRNCVKVQASCSDLWKGYNAIVGGSFNRICDDKIADKTSRNFIGGGNSNQITGSKQSAIIGSVSSVIRNSSGATILGGCSVSVVASGVNGKANYVIAAHRNFTIDPSPCTFYTCNIIAAGALTKGTGTFKIDHPNPKLSATHDLYHSFVESPTAGDNIYRFTVTTVNNEAEIILPEYYRYLNKDSQLWVSADGHFGKAFGLVNISTTKIKITSNEDGKYNIMLVGTRKDIEATKAWKGAVHKKTETEKLNYKNNL
jgi:hypothetical protein